MLTRFVLVRRTGTCRANRRPTDGENPLLDLVYLLGVFAVFALIGVVAWGGGEAVIVFDVIAAVLAVGALGCLVLALVEPERFSWRSGWASCRPSR